MTLIPNPGLWLFSFLAGHWKIVLLLVICATYTGAVYVMGSHNGAMGVQMRWNAQKAADAAAVAQAQAENAERLNRQRQATMDAARKFADAQVENLRLAGVNAALADRLRAALTAPVADDVPAATAPAGEPEPEGVRVDAVTAAIALSGFARECAADRDRIGEQVNGLLDAWPR